MQTWRAVRAGVMVVAVIGLAMGGLALAQDPAATDGANPVPPAAFERILDLLAPLGLTPIELREAAQKNESLADVAATQGVATDELVGRIVAPVEERLTDAVAAGDLTEDEAAARLDEARSRVTDRVTRPIRDRRPGDRRRDR